MDKGELDDLISKAGISKQAAGKLRAAYNADTGAAPAEPAPRSSGSGRRGSGHGAPAPDRTRVPTL